jgi:hypothetical protein
MKYDLYPISTILKSLEISNEVQFEYHSARQVKILNEETWRHFGSDAHFPSELISWACFIILNAKTHRLEAISPDFTIRIYGEHEGIFYRNLTKDFYYVPSIYEFIYKYHQHHKNWDKWHFIGDKVLYDIWLMGRYTGKH